MDTQDNTENIISNLKGNVATLLVTEHDCTIEEAEDLVGKSYASKPEFWSDKADPKELANLLASDENED